MGSRKQLLFLLVVSSVGSIITSLLLTFLFNTASEQELLTVVTGEARIQSDLAYSISTLADEMKKHDPSFDTKGYTDQAYSLASSSANASNPNTLSSKLNTTQRVVYNHLDFVIDITLGVTVVYQLIIMIVGVALNLIDQKKKQGSAEEE